MTRTLTRLALVGALTGCAEESSQDPWADWFTDDETLLDASHANVIQRFEFLAEDETGVQGFDLDGVNDDDATAACGLGDGVSPDGEGGIDNQFGRMWQLVEGLVGEQVQELLQGSINEGRFLILVELVGVDDLQNDDDVTVRLSRGAGDPWVGGTGVIAADQTYRIDPSVPTSVVEGVAIVDGELEAGPVDFTLPIDILEANFPLVVRDGRLRLQIDAEGHFTGMLGGIVDVEATLAELLATDAAQEAALVAPFFRSNADVKDPSGACTYMSSAFGFEATTAFVVHPRQE